MLFNYMIFMMPLYVVIYSWGMVMLMPSGGEHKNPLKNLINPVCISLVLGMLLGILALPLPGFVTTVLSNTGSCMAPARDAAYRFHHRHVQCEEAALGQESVYCQRFSAC